MTVNLHDPILDHNVIYVQIWCQRGYFFLECFVDQDLNFSDQIPGYRKWADA